MIPTRERSWTWRRYSTRILNLFSGIGGNRALWGDDHDITAVDHLLGKGPQRRLY
jgi:hypothetical protein